MQEQKPRFEIFEMCDVDEYKSAGALYDAADVVTWIHNNTTLSMQTAIIKKVIKVEMTDATGVYELVIKNGTPVYIMKGATDAKI